MHSMLLLNPLDHICLAYILLARTHHINLCCVLHPKSNFTLTVLGDAAWIKGYVTLSPFADGTTLGPTPVLQESQSLWGWHGDPGDTQSPRAWWEQGWMGLWVRLRSRWSLTSLPTHTVILRNCVERVCRIHRSGRIWWKKKIKLPSSANADVSIQLQNLINTSNRTDST